MPSQDNGPPEREDRREDDRRYLIATGTAQYDHLPDDLPSVEEDLRRIHQLLCEEGTYQRSVEDLGDDLALNPDSGELRAVLDEWFSAEDRTVEDVAVLYYSGHGGVEGEGGMKRHYLLTRDSRPGLLTSTALPAEEIARYIGKSSLRRILLLLDTCFAGYGSGDITKNLSDLQDFFSEEHVHVSIIAASWPKGEAHEGTFIEALSSVLGDTRWAGERQTHVPPGSIASGINQYFEKEDLSQTAVHYSITTGTGHPPFFRNPRYEPDLPEGIDLREQRRISSMDPGEARLHWGPRGRGVEIDTQPGWYFTGRQAILKELVECLERSAEDGDAIVVTGPPGVGKSAVLARLVTLADPEFRDRAPLESVDHSGVPPVGSIDVAVHAKKKTLSDVVHSISRKAGKKTTDPDDLIQLLERREDSFTIVLDALDEAEDPETVAHDLLRRLTTLSTVSLLVGTREGPIQDLGPRIEIRDLEDPEYHDQDDLATYAERRLLAEGEPGVNTPYQNRPELARSVAGVVAEKADPIFLIARLICEDLIDAKEVVDPDDPEWREQLPESVSGAFEGYLSRFGPDEFKIRDLLRPIAYAQGAGLPWENLWAPLASALSPHDRSYTDEDVAWVLEKASSYLVEDLLEGRSVYRLYHQAFADFFRDEERNRERHRQMAETLAASVPDLKEGDGKDWRKAHPYVRHHLSTHAAAGEVLSEFTDNPMYLVWADPSRLVTALEHARAEDLGQTAKVFQQSYPKLRDEVAEGRASYLELGACKRGTFSLVERIKTLPLDRKWEAQWVQWNPSSPHRPLAEHTNEVGAVAMGIMKDRPVVVSASIDGEIQVWAVDPGERLRAFKANGGSVRDLAVGTGKGRLTTVTAGRNGTARIWAVDSGECLHSLEGHDGWIEAVETGTIEGRPIVVSGGTDGTVQVWEADSGDRLQVLEGHVGWIRTLAFGTVEGRPVVVSGSQDETAQVWAADTGERLRDLKGHSGWIEAVETGTIEGRPIVVSGGTDGTVRLWAADTGECIQILKSHDGSVSAVAPGSVKGRPVIVSGGDDEMIRIWAADTGERIRVLKGHTGPVEAVLTVENRPIIVSGGCDETVRLWAVDLNSPSQYFEGSTDQIEALDLGTVDHYPVIVSGSRDGAVRIWRVDSGRHLRAVDGHDGPVRTLEMGTVGGRSVIVSGGTDRTVRIWAANTGECLQNLEGHDGWIEAVAAATIESRLIIVSGSDDTEIRIWAADTGECLHVLKGHDGWVSAVAMGTVEDRPIIVSGSRDETMRVWAADTGECLRVLKPHDGWIRSLSIVEARNSQSRVVSGSTDGTVRLWSTNNWESYQTFQYEAEIYAVDIEIVDGRPMIVSGSPDGAVRVLDRDHFSDLSSHTDEVHAVAVGIVKGRSIIASGSHDQTIRVKTADHGESLHILEGHIDSILAVAAGTIENRSIIISGSADGTVRVWDADSGKCSNVFQCGGRVSAAAIGTVRNHEVFAYGSGREISIMRVDSGVSSYVQPGHDHMVSDIAIGMRENHPTIISGSLDGTVRISSVGKRPLFRANPDHVLQHGDEVHGVAMGKVSSLLTIVSGGESGTVRTWKAGSGECLCVFEGHGAPVSAVEIGEFEGLPVIVSGGESGTVRIWEADTGECLHVFERHDAPVSAVEMGKLEDHPIIISGSYDKTVRVWDPFLGEKLFTIKIGSRIHSLSAQSGRIVVGAERGLAYIKLTGL